MQMRAGSRAPFRHFGAPSAWLGARRPNLIPFLQRWRHRSAAIRPQQRPNSGEYQELAHRPRMVGRSCGLKAALPNWYTRGGPVTATLINTPLQRGARRGRSLRNRFNGFSQSVETVETVSVPHRTARTPLKRGVNESQQQRRLRCCEKSGLRPSDILAGCQKPRPCA